MIRGKFLTSMDDISQVMDLRRSIFCDEMGFSGENEPDEHDNMAVYALAYAEDGTPIATGRMYIADDRFNIGRVCVLLGTPDFKYMSGETLTLEGGMGQRP